MRMKMLAAIAIVASVCGCAGTPSTDGGVKLYASKADLTKYPPGGIQATYGKVMYLTDNADEIVEAFKRDVEYDLKDPESAQYRDVFVLYEYNTSPNSGYVCGLVNAKNSHGGYVGFETFSRRYNVESDGRILILGLLRQECDPILYNIRQKSS